jgi:hypothetical protein
MQYHLSEDYDRGTLYPLIYLICAEGFLALLNKADETGVLSGIRICHNAPRINHLLFADDSLVLMKASRQGARSLQSILQLYECCSGQTINYDDV